MGAPTGPIAILGCGAVGTALAKALGGGGYRLVLWSRNPDRARRAGSLARRAGAPEVELAARALDAVGSARLVLLCVAEPALPKLAQELRSKRRPKRARARRPSFLVVSGGAPLEPLARGFASLGRVGRLHPLCPVLEGDSARVFQGMPFGVEGPPAVAREARRLVRVLGGTALRLSGKGAVRYHAGAALLGGGTVALLELAEQCMAEAVPSRRHLRRALLAFVVRNASNVARRGTRAALTGPIARGAHETVASHQRALGRIPFGRATYGILGRTMLALAGSRSGGARAGLARVRSQLGR